MNCSVNIKLLYKILLATSLLLCSLVVSAEDVVLKSGAVVRGTIVLQNEEVVIVKDATGARFQYPMSDVETIREETDEVLLEEIEIVTRVERKVGVSVQLSGGGMVVPNSMSGGNVSADLVVGGNNLLNRGILLGGGIGYHAALLDGNTYSFLPIQVRAEVPFLKGKHMPMMGVGLGYGIGLNKEIKGGLYAGLDLGYKCLFPHKGGLFVGIYSSFQGAQLMTTETIEETEYQSFASRSLVGFGAKLSFYF